MQVTIYKNIRETSAGFVRDVDYVFSRIKNGKSKDLVEKIRKEKEAKNIADLKKMLPSICFSGTFKARNDLGLIRHSGLICLDFDKYNSDEELRKEREKLEKNKYVYACFLSPSGNGLKVLVKVPPDKEKHKDYFEALGDYFNSPNFDRQCSNISRVCFESYDPFIYKNNDSFIFDKINIKNKEIGVLLPSIPLENEGEIIKKLLKWFSENYSMANGQRNVNLFKLASAFNDFGVDKFEAERVAMQFVCHDFGEREILDVIKSAYRNTANFRTKFFEDSYKKKKIEESIKSGQNIKEISKNLKLPHTGDFFAKIKENISAVNFWEINEKGKVAVHPHKYKLFLQENGYFKFYPEEGESFIFVKVCENLVEDCGAVQIKDFVLAYLFDKLDEIGVLPYDYMANSTKFFKEDYLSFLDTIEIKLKQDTKDICYLYFLNCSVEISKKEIKKIDYLDLDGFVWKNQVIQRIFDFCDPTGCDFEIFLKKISGANEDRFNSFGALAGYLLHSFKNSSENRAIILNDEVISENPNGGSGKGIFCSAIGKMKKMVSIDGKHFSFDKSFPYQLVQADTQVLLFDDVKKNFNFENLFSVITEGITIEKKNKDAIKIPVQRSPKILITTNYTIGGVGGSHERRKHEYEFSSYFSAEYTPLDEFKRMLFDDWDAQEWMKFDNFMIICVQVFLLGGLLRNNFKNLQKRKFIKETSFEFVEWACEDSKIPLETRVYKGKSYEDFVLDNPDFKHLSRKKYNQWIQSYADFLGKNYESSQDSFGRFFEIK